MRSRHPPMPWMWQRPSRRVERSGEDHSEFVFARRGEDESSGGPSRVRRRSPPFSNGLVFLPRALCFSSSNPSLPLAAGVHGVLARRAPRSSPTQPWRSRRRREFKGKADLWGATDQRKWGPSSAAHGSFSHRRSFSLPPRHDAGPRGVLVRPPPGGVDPRRGLYYLRLFNYASTPPTDGKCF